jgi:hypothetical protein
MITKQKKPRAKKQPKRDINQIAFSVVQAVIEKSEGNKSKNQARG